MVHVEVGDRADEKLGDHGEADGKADGKVDEEESRGVTSKLRRGRTCRVRRVRHVTVSAG
jgi:hypothetical protein